jgi:outer membrane biosynthesis protein TonB
MVIVRRGIMAKVTLDFKKFQIAVKSFNDSGVIKKKILLKKDYNINEIIDLFLSAIEQVPEAKEAELPEECIDMYNFLAEAFNKKKDVVYKNLPSHLKEQQEVVDKVIKAAMKEEEKKEEVKEEKKEKATKKKTSKKKETKPKEEVQEEKKEETTKKKKKEPTGKKQRGEKDELGAIINSGTSKINQFLLKGETLKKIAAQVGTPEGRVKNHIYALSKRGFEFDKEPLEKGDYYIKIKK